MTILRKRTNPPLCKCGCKRPVKINPHTKTWSSYIHGHHNRGRTGPNWPCWKGGMNISKNGYVYIYKPDHPFCDVNKRVKEERLTMEKILGRYLSPEEIVHHKNGIKNDNSPDNLELFLNQYEHKKYHGKLKMNLPKLTHLPEETRQKISTSLKGKPKTQEHIQKVSEALRRRNIK